jgi:hypothetical protein
MRTSDLSNMPATAPQAQMGKEDLRVNVHGNGGFPSQAVNI